MKKYLTFGEIIKKCREELKLSQENLAKAIREKYNVRLSTSYLSMIETGVRVNLNVKLINALLDYLNLPQSAAFSLFVNSHNPLEYDDLYNPDVTIPKTENSYTSKKTREFGEGLPVEAQKPLAEICALLAKYNDK